MHYGGAKQLHKALLCTSLLRCPRPPAYAARVWTFRALKENGQPVSLLRAPLYMPGAVWKQGIGKTLCSTG